MSVGGQTEILTFKVLHSYPTLQWRRDTDTRGIFLQFTLFYKNQIIFVKARCSYSKMTKISNFAHTLPLFYAFEMLFRMSTFIYNNSTIRNLASSWVTSPAGRKSEPSCSYKVCSYIKKCTVGSHTSTSLLHNDPFGDSDESTWANFSGQRGQSIYQWYIFGTQNYSL